MSGSSERRIGTHVFRYDPPDIIYTGVHGVLGADDVRALCDEIVAVTKEKQKKDLLFAITDMSDMESITSDARGAIRDLPVFNGVAIIGVSRQMRYLLQFINKAYKMWKRGADTPMVFFDTLAEANQWVEERRKVLSAS